MKAARHSLQGFLLFLAAFGALPLLFVLFGAHDALRGGWLWMKPSGRSILICAAAALAALAGLSALPRFRAAAGSPGVRRACFVLLPLVALVAGVEALSGIYLRARFPPEEIMFSSGRLGHPLYAGFDWQDELIRTSARIQYRYAPFRLWQAEPLESPLVNIAEDGTRLTTPAPAASGAAPFTVHLYGGSTVFCLEVPDEYTLASCLGRALSRRMPGRAVAVRNLGVPSYVREQEALWFQMQLDSGEKPDLAVFYDGANDMATCGWEGQRHKELGRFETAMRGTERPIWELGGEALRGFTNAGNLFSELRRQSARRAEPPAEAEISARAARAASGYLAAGKRIRSAAREQGVAAAFFLQPNLYLKDSPAPREQSFLDFEKLYRPGIERVAALFAESVAAGEANLGTADFFDLSDAFDSDSEEAYFDIFHVGPRQNERLAELMAERLAPLLESPAN